VPPEKIVVLENGVQANVFRPQASSELRTKLGADGKVVVSYIGTIGMAHGLETLVEAASRLQHSTPEVLFLLVGEGAEKERIISLVRSRGLTNVRFVDQQLREKVPAYICVSDVCLVLLKKAEIFRTVLPTKMLEFMSCGRPVILGVDGQARQVMEAANGGIFVEPGSPDDLTRAISQLAAAPSLRETLGRNGRRYVVQHFSRQRTARAYLNMLEGLLGEEALRAAVAA
jgi:glycosyltransferase involved in cell wall biosynthesis